MLLMFLRSLAEDEYVANEDQHKLRQLVHWILCTVSIIFSLVKQPVHDSLESCWCIIESKWQHFKLVVTIGSPECCFWPIFIFE